LIVHDDRDIVSGREMPDGTESIVWNSRSAVETDEGANAGWGWKRAEDGVPLYLKINVEGYGRL
jgi:hypothetical protein